MINQYCVVKTLGEGSFATVKLCKDTNTGNMYALKQMSKAFLQKKKTGQGKNAYDCVKDELKVLEKLEHPNIIYLHEIIDDPNKDEIYLVTEYHSNGSLGAAVEKRNLAFEAINNKFRQEKKFSKIQSVGLPDKLLRMYFHDILRAIYYCHNIIKVIHRDIKPENIVINHNNEAVLIDFGVSAIVEGLEDDEVQGGLGSMLFFAPEMFEKKEGVKIRGERTDIWALGFTLFYLMTGRFPFEEAQNPFALKKLVIEEEIDFSLVKNEYGRQLLKRMLEKDQEKRATLDEIMESPWVTDNGRSDLDLDLKKVKIFKDGREGFGNVQRFV